MNAQINRDERENQAETLETRRGVVPAVDIFENKTELLIVADLPGVGPNDIAVRLDKNELTIAGKRASAPEGSALAVEGRPGDFTRTFLVPQGIVADGISAEVTQGVLKVRLPKVSAQKPRQITVKAS
ncbi:Hsp20/alpha crystallin family protein [Polyangium jinanense]|uniref:Hsp20/alpha crystallin family protein n=1 Tax=Polyangium jinanense TaxID=2829994 RepID=A0A9X4APP0_9BACT|nr:Hsp20/alpha crystallin family protein [Polyangium jinanense]MDC3952585.1 Hsp20/alpha crystallin family protein [Polyangium jinanense]MDC3980213.1 Hsp20/alpha crystallin family protein [Polyangium jinanense]